MSTRLDSRSHRSSTPMVRVGAERRKLFRCWTMCAGVALASISHQPGPTQSRLFRKRLQFVVSTSTSVTRQTNACVLAINESKLRSARALYCFAPQVICNPKRSQPLSTPYAQPNRPLLSTFIHTPAHGVYVQQYLCFISNTSRQVKASTHPPHPHGYKAKLKRLKKQLQDVTDPPTKSRPPPEPL